ncbi:MAG: diacylglycerol kinase family protein [Chloroflexota bacterium]|nr:diacylglycerol kinase family protein [Chloroflexota bacterium]
MIVRFIKSRLNSFKHALVGWWHVIKTQQNAWIHAIATVTTIIIAVWLELPLGDWAVLLVTITMVWAAEFLNTALEIVVDLTSPNLHPLAKAGKDVGAAAVLIAAMSAVVIGIMLLGPPLVNKINILIKSLSSM